MIIHNNNLNIYKSVTAEYQYDSDWIEVEAPPYQYFKIMEDGLLVDVDTTIINESTYSTIELI